MGPHVSIQSHNKTKSTYREQLSIVKWLLASSLCPQYPRTSRIYHHFPRTIYTSAMTIRDLDQLHVGRSHKNWTPKILQILHNRNNKWSCSAFIQNKSFQIRNIPQAVYFFLPSHNTVLIPSQSKTADDFIFPGYILLPFPMVSFHIHFHSPVQMNIKPLLDLWYKFELWLI